MLRATTNHDPYAECRANCAHDLTSGVLLADLLGSHGPHPALMVIDQRRARVNGLTSLRRAG